MQIPVQAMVFHGQRSTIGQLVRGRSDGTYFHLEKVAPGQYSCVMAVVKNSRIATRHNLEPNTLGGYLQTISNLRQRSNLVKGIFLSEEGRDGATAALKRLEKPIQLHYISIDK